MAFNPAIPPTCVKAYYEADKITSVDGTIINTWNDASGNNNHLATTDTSIMYRSGVNGIANNPAVQFNGGVNGFRVTLNAVINQTDTIFIIFKANNFSNWLFDDILEAYETNRQTFGSATNKITSYAGTVLSSTTPIDTLAHFAEIQFNGASSYIKLDGVQIALGNTGTNSMNAIALANSSAVGTVYTGLISCVIVCDSTMTNTNLTDIETYLTNKYTVAVVTTNYKLTVIGTSIDKGRIPPNNTGDLVDGTDYPHTAGTNYLGANWLINNIAVSNTNTSLWTGSNFIANVQPSFDATKTNVLIIGAPTNDVSLNANFNISGDNAWNAVRSICQSAIANNWQHIIISSLLPRDNLTGSGITVANFETFRTRYNNYVYTQGQKYASNIMDIARDIKMGYPGAQNDTVYFMDKCHPTTVGNARIANYAGVIALESLSMIAGYSLLLGVLYNLMTTSLTGSIGGFV